MSLDRTSWTHYSNGIQCCWTGDNIDRIFFSCKLNCRSEVIQYEIWNSGDSFWVGATFSEYFRLLSCDVLLNYWWRRYRRSVWWFVDLFVYLHSNYCYWLDLHHFYFNYSLIFCFSAVNDHRLEMDANEVATWMMAQQQSSHCSPTNSSHRSDLACCLLNCGPV